MGQLPTKRRFAGCGLRILKTKSLVIVHTCVFKVQGGREHRIRVFGLLLLLHPFLTQLDSSIPAVPKKEFMICFLQVPKLSCQYTLHGFIPVAASIPAAAALSSNNPSLTANSITAITHS